MRKILIILIFLLLLAIKFLLIDYFPILAYLDFEIAILAIIISRFKNLNFILILVGMGVILDLRNIFYPLGLTAVSILIVYLITSIISSWHFCKSIKFSLPAVGWIAITKFLLIGLFTKERFNIDLFQREVLRNFFILTIIWIGLNFLSYLFPSQLKERN